MALPDYQTLMLPLLKTLGDGKEYHIKQSIEKLAAEFQLTEEDRKLRLPSGTVQIFENRVHWAKTYLKKAGLLDNPRRAHLIITDRGLGVLKSNPPLINVTFLKQFPEFIEFQNLRHDEKTEQTVVESQNNVTPEDLLESGYIRIRTALVEELISKVVSFTSVSFKLEDFQLVI